MTATLTPLPSPASGLGAGVVKVSSWKPIPNGNTPSPAVSSVTSLPSLPDAKTPISSRLSAFWPAPLTVLPAATASTAAISPLPSAVFAPQSPSAPEPIMVPATIIEPPDFTDDELFQAFAPIVQHAFATAGSAKDNGHTPDIEPMLRATIRRALAEYSPASRPFQAPGTVDRFVWHLQALFTSRTFEDILFEKTHRFQVEEVFLLDISTLALISFASCDPARHSSAKRVSNTVHRLAMQLRDEENKIRDSFELPDERFALSKIGNHVILLSVVRGETNDLILADLEFSLKRIENHFREQFKNRETALLHTLQPFLEDCLLIQAPASAA